MLSWTTIAVVLGALVGVGTFVLGAYQLVFGEIRARRTEVAELYGRLVVTQRAHLDCEDRCARCLRALESAGG